MRLTKGIKVEVFSTKQVPIGEWRCAEVISGNGHNYTVKYGWFAAMKNLAVERVPRKVIRPVPPPREGKLIIGDVVEVFDHFSWKICKIVDNFYDDYFLVRVLGLNLEIRVHKLRLRIRQCLKDGNWFVIGKVNSDSVIGSTRVPKRRFNEGFSCDFSKKRKVCEILDKIDFDDQRNFGEDSSSTISGDSYSCGSSVGSCSLIGGNDVRIREHDARFEDDCASDAESWNMRGNEERSCSFCSDEEWRAEGCRLELVDYRKAIGEIFAAGPLSWEDEAKLTNLRLQLQISDDEHLMAVRNLISANA